MDRVGATSVANCNGMKMTVIAYRGATDLDIQFEDGQCVYHKSWWCFVAGKIKYPIEAFIGMSKQMRNGHICTITDVRGYEDFDVIFDNGVKNVHQNMSNFKRGVVGFPKSYLQACLGSLYRSRIGAYKVMNSGIGAIVIAYRSGNDIDIQFDTGEVKESVRWSNFVRGTVAPYEKYDKTGFSNRMSNGMLATIIVWRCYSDIDVQFEDGKVRTHMGYKEFKNGKIAHDTYEEKILSRIGETVKHLKTGMYMTLIDYRSALDVDVEFEDGTVVTNKPYGVFRDGMVFYEKSDYVPKANRLNQVYIMQNGLSAECIAYRDAHDIDIRFIIDGTVVCNKAWHDFMLGKIAHPNFRLSSSYLEQNVLMYLDIKGFQYDTQVIFKDEGLVGFGGGYLSYDFAVLDDNLDIILLIECQGQQHYKPIDLFGGKEQFELQMLHDEMKREFAKSHYIPLLEISYLEDTYEKVSAFLDLYFSRI